MTAQRSTFSGHHPLAGPLLWILSAQYFIVQFVAARVSTAAYSLTRNTISDLGNTVCGQYGGRFVCSPAHGWMNASFMLLGVSMAAGSVLMYQALRKNAGSAIGFGCLFLSGSGALLIGLFPENTVAGLHVTGATLSFLIGNIGLVALGCALSLSRALRYYTIVSGIFALAALALFMTGHYLGIGIGGMERLVAYPQTVWLIVFGIYRLRAKT
ncbi:MAG: DUF998 domain-containing protein [Candidatus Saccharibacteria bacterium]